jgi:hypothetical protein
VASERDGPEVEWREREEIVKMGLKCLSLLSTFGVFLALNGRPATIEYRKAPNLESKSSECQDFYGLKMERGEFFRDDWQEHAWFRERSITLPRPIILSHNPRDRLASVQRASPVIFF